MTSNVDILAGADNFVGTLAHELGHFEDPDAQALTNSLRTGSVADEVNFLFTELVGEGKAVYNNFQVFQEIKARSGGGDTISLSLSPNNFLNTYNDAVSKQGDAVQQIALFTGSHSAFAVGFKPSYVQYYGDYWASRATSNFFSRVKPLDLTGVTSVAVKYNADGTATMTLVRSANTGTANDVFVVKNGNIIRPPEGGPAQHALLQEMDFGTKKQDFAYADTDEASDLTTTQNNSDTVRFNLDAAQVIKISQLSEKAQAVASPSGPQIDAATQGASGTITQTFEGFGSFTSGYGDDTISVADGTDTSTLRVVDGGGGNNTIYAGSGSKTIYYGGSYGTNTLYGDAKYDAKAVSRLVGGPSADDLQYHADNPDLPSLGDPTASDVTIHSGLSDAVMVGGPGTNDFIVDVDGGKVVHGAGLLEDGSATPPIGRQIIWGGGGTSTYELKGGNVLIYHMDDPTAKKVANLDFSIFDKLDQNASVSGGLQGMTIIIDPGPNDRIMVDGKQIVSGSGYLNNGVSTLTMLSPDANESPGFTFDRETTYNQYGYSLGDEITATHTPYEVADRVQSVSIRDFTQGDFGITDYYQGSGFTYAAFKAGQDLTPITIDESYYYDEDGVRHDVQTPGIEYTDPNGNFRYQDNPDPAGGFTHDEVNTIESGWRQSFTATQAFVDGYQDPVPVLDVADGDGSNLSPDQPDPTQNPGGGPDQPRPILISGGSNVTFSLAASDGPVTIDNYSTGNDGTLGTILFDASVSAADITVGSDAAGDLLLTNSATGSAVTVTKALSDPDYAIAGVSFADGSSINGSQFAALAATGSPANASIYGFSGSDILDSKGYARTAQGAGGSDTFVYAPGYGQLTINEDVAAASPVGTNTLRLGAGIAPADLSASSPDGSDLVIRDGVTGDQVTLTDMLADAGAGVQQVTFADGTAWTGQQLAALAMTSTAGADSLYGTKGADTFDGLGAPAGSQDYEQGNGGADTFVFDPGYGQLEVNEDAGDQATSAATLQLGAGITAADLAVSSDASGDVLLSDGTAGDEVTLDAMLRLGWAGNAQYGVAQVRLADGTVLARQQILDLATTGTAGADTLYGTAGADTLDGEGAPAGSQDLLQGNGGADTFVFDPGYGQLEVNENNDYATSTATLQLGAGSPRASSPPPRTPRATSP